MDIVRQILKKARLAPVALTLLLMMKIACADGIPDDTCTNEYIIPTTPSTDFMVVGDADDGIVRHDSTGLEWRRCPEGMTWNEKDGSCDGEAEGMDWQAALEHAGGIDGWRLPDFKELASIQEHCRAVPGINRQVFPDTPTVWHWSASPYQGDPNNARVIGFHNAGGAWHGSKSNEHLVRLVRVAQ